MRLNSADGAQLELRIAGYQFDAPSPQWWDRNWLVVHGEVRLIDGRLWSFDDPCLTTREAADLDDLLRRGTDGELTFVEPNLCFRLDRGFVHLRLRAESSPPWLPDRIAGITVTLRVDASGLRAAADEWRDERIRYPEI